MNVTILGNEYPVRELSLAQKNKLLGSIGELIQSIAKHAFFKKDGNGGFSFNFDDEVGLDALNIDSLILSSINILPELLALAVPDFKEWDNLPESESREALKVAVEVQDLKGYFANFFSLFMSIIRLN